MKTNPQSLLDFTSQQKENTHRLGNIFAFKGGNSGLTEEFIYNNQPATDDEKVLIFSGATLQNNSMGFVSENACPNGKKLKFFQNPAIIIVRKGNAGKMMYLGGGKYTVNDDVYVLTPKKEWADKINLRWFAYQYQELFFNLVTSKSDNATFNKEYAEKQNVIIPELSKQLNQVLKKIYLENIESQMSKLITSFRNITFNTVMRHEIGNCVVLDNILHFKGGNSGLTEEFIYNNQPATDDEKVPILSSATKKANLMGYISKKAMPNNKELKIFKSRCILVARNGYAGIMTYIGSGEFTANDHAYVLTPKKEWADKINLRWFAYQYQELFFNLVTSKSDNATFNKEYAEKQNVIIPDIKYQDMIAKKLLEMDSLIEELETLNIQIKKLLEQEIIP